MIYEPALLMNTINGFAAKKNTNMRFRKFALNEYMCGIPLLGTLSLHSKLPKAKFLISLSLFNSAK